MKSRKGKADASDSEDTHEDEVENRDRKDVASEPESASSENAKVKSKRKSRHAKKKGINAGSEDGGTEAKKRKRSMAVGENPEVVEYEVGKH
jgi:hypothetical protein